MALPEFNKKYKIESAAFPGKYLFIRPPSVPNAYFIGDGGVTVYSGANPPIIKMTPEAGNTVGFNNAEGNMFVLKNGCRWGGPQPDLRQWYRYRYHCSRCRRLWIDIS